MAMSYIGKAISLISHSDVRYRGILAGIDPANSTIQLSNVYSMGTESRRPPAEFIPPNTEPYQYIIFRASEVKDLAVDDPVPARNVNSDPAVLGAAPMPPSGYGFGQQPVGLAPQPPINGGYGQQIPNGPSPGFDPSQQQARSQAPQQTPVPTRSRSGNSVSTATASLQTVERAIGDLRGGEREGNNNRRGGGRGGREIKAGDLRVPVTDFDFESSNKRFDKNAIKSPGTDHPASPGLGADGEAPGEEEHAEEPAYNPKKSFFDSLSASTGGGSAPHERGRGRGRGGRTRREEERERNVATFGEPGGVGLMGPGAYVGGWGGYGRRGGGRGGAGGPRDGGRRDGGRGRAAAGPRA
ncbi:hypothetical protein PUNSTDRAFT_114533 [Punctularia strigosozonata HHB-11173 SS5]|uniref:uncharacterized protein n=1 Tax=Punctularia strigosozonata (strain HHB-11173) TaxID=741275 RepID=UPI0004416697|nr:uncharacterized protein PUNSTDRAFT_114533 [Punctularia strigosozonata HHB-11173 SS5]EIN07026.1 hypothetical protein PUNSTDRAFT_114533 [Punctularia strigosozonata HHB-11173 SS5]